MVSTYTHLSLTALRATKSTLLGMVFADDRVCAHLDAIEAELQRRTYPMVRREAIGIDDEGCETYDAWWACPNCDRKVRPSNPFCPTCGQGLRPAA
jgi:hypothetical protein